MDAFRIAERVRANIADLSIIAPGATGGERVQVTVSIGVAALDSGSKRDLSELMAAADAALYRAKAGGRDQVQMISTTRGLSAISGNGAGVAARSVAQTRQACSAARRIPDSRGPDQRLNRQVQLVVRMMAFLLLSITWPLSQL